MSGPAKSRVRESLLGGFVTTLEKRACKLTKRGSMSRFRESLKDVGKPVRIIMHFY